MVFFNEKYGDFNSALNHKDGLTVLAFFYEVNIKLIHFKRISSLGDFLIV